MEADRISSQQPLWSLAGKTTECQVAKHQISYPEGIYHICVQCRTTFSLCFTDLSDDMQQLQAITENTCSLDSCRLPSVSLGCKCFCSQYLHHPPELPEYGMYSVIIDLYVSLLWRIGQNWLVARWTFVVALQTLHKWLGVCYMLKQCVTSISLLSLFSNLHVVFFESCEASLGWVNQASIMASFLFRS